MVQVMLLIVLISEREKINAILSGKRKDEVARNTGHGMFLA
jgi:hypothetical protein